MRRASAARGDGNCLASARAVQSSFTSGAVRKLPSWDDRGSASVVLRAEMHVWQQSLLQEPEGAAASQDYLAGVRH